MNVPILTHPRYTMANQTDVQIAHRKYLIVQDIQSASTSNGITPKCLTSCENSLKPRKKE